ncbi:metal-sulfur cluster assembly factor [Sinomonas sp. JGH33]|uniref:Metal-sulfur cluster assembly factor n=1 Tax=Sinomonas terricola TaxID=3110330 RepID=A0ABU5T3Z8_9MICC|nr:metal-sulfur cluster assembly factor [Sinomonas sp. JGH33]MEA5454384.1 metal-sulfur cluster assembly factor [Sinomonas sp. JGH33]
MSDAQPAAEIQPEQTSLEDVEERLKDVIDPELGVNVVDLGLVYGLEYGEDGALLISMTLTTAACPLTDMLEEQVGQALDGVVDEWRLNWVWMPPWGPDRITEDGRDQMRALGFNI